MTVMCTGQALVKRVVATAAVMPATTVLTTPAPISEDIAPGLKVYAVPLIVQCIAPAPAVSHRAGACDILCSCSCHSHCGASGNHSRSYCCSAYVHGSSSTIPNSRSSADCAVEELQRLQIVLCILGDAELYAVFLGSADVRHRPREPEVGLLSLQPRLRYWAVWSSGGKPKLYSLGEGTCWSSGRPYSVLFLEITLTRVSFWTRVT